MKLKGGRMNKKGLKQASSVAGYILLVVTVMANGNSWFGEDDRGMLAPLLALTMLSVSVLVCALLVLAEPYKLFVAKKGNEALELVISTTKWLIAYLLFLIVGIIVSGMIWWDNRKLNLDYFTAHVIDKVGVVGDIENTTMIREERVF